MSTDSMVKQFVRNELAQAVHAARARLPVHEVRTVFELSMAQITAANQKQTAEAPKDKTMSETNNRSSDVPLEVYEQILTGPKSSEQETTEFWNGVTALFQDEKRKEIHSDGI
jgi:hypothetical protein